MFAFQISDGILSLTVQRCIATTQNIEASILFKRKRKKENLGGFGIQHCSRAPLLLRPFLDIDVYRCCIAFMLRRWRREIPLTLNLTQF